MNGATPITTLPSLSPNWLTPANVERVLAVIFALVFIWWLIFTVVMAYHLFKYARESWLAVPLLALHLFVSGWIFVFAIGGFH